ncbi:hypothetical protein [Staphylococcus simulans]|uniref:hypothetical protein n=1 Tax=Staphylococcus simulans TaxID=1286 RepID=UPI000D047960|nr:hypothetical protein [Staphylococcus simulans]
MKQTLIWQSPKSVHRSLNLDAFYLTKIWHAFDAFQQKHQAPLILRNKVICQYAPLIEGESYKAELICRSQKKLRQFIHYCYVLTMISLRDNKTCMEITTTFIEQTDSSSKIEQKAKQPSNPSTISSQYIPLVIDWEDVLDYLKQVNDYNPIHLHNHILPGDYVVMAALETLSKRQESLNTVQEIEVKFKQMMHRTDQLWMNVKEERSLIKIQIVNQAAETCVEVWIKV